MDQLDAKIHTATPEGAADTGRNESSAFVVTPYGSFLWAAAAVVAKLMPLRQLRQIAKEKGPEGPFSSYPFDSWSYPDVANFSGHKKVARSQGDRKEVINIEQDIVA